VLVHAAPFHPDAAWGAYQIISTAAAGTLIASLAGSLAGAASAPFVASLVVQASYGFAFTAYDPYSAEPMVFVFAALLTWCWLTNRPWHAAALCAVGVFTKETVALLAGVLALAAVLDRSVFARSDSPERDWRTWLVPVIVSGALLASFHIASRLWLNWQIESNPAAQMSHGSWLGLWWRNNPLIERKAYMVFATYGFAWIFALLGWHSAPRAWRALALATMPAMLFLLVIQTPERALGNAFFVVIPLALLFASRSPAPAAVALSLNALITAKAGSSSLWLPSARWTLIPAAIAAIVVIARVNPKIRGSSPPSPDLPYRRT
jgi:hypothetical protein